MNFVGYPSREGGIPESRLGSEKQAALPATPEPVQSLSPLRSYRDSSSGSGFKSPNQVL